MTDGDVVEAGEPRADGDDLSQGPVLEPETRGEVVPAVSDGVGERGQSDDMDVQEAHEAPAPARPRRHRRGAQLFTPSSGARGVQVARQHRVATPDLPIDFLARVRALLTEAAGSLSSVNVRRMLVSEARSRLRRVGGDAWEAAGEECVSAAAVAHRGDDVSDSSVQGLYEALQKERMAAAANAAEAEAARRVFHGKLRRLSSEWLRSSQRRQRSIHPSFPALQSLGNPR